MIDEPTPPETQDTAGTEDTPTEAPSTTDWEQRYASLQPEYTRATQEAAQLRQEKETAEQTAYAWQLLNDAETDPDLRRQAQEFLGIPADEPEGQDDDDELAAIKKELADLKGWRDQETQTRQQAQEAEQYGTLIGEGVKSLQEGEGVELSDPELATLYALCTVMEDEKGQPKVQEAWDLFMQVGKAGSERILKGKRNVPSPRSGEDASKRPDMSNRASRIAHMEEKLSAAEAE